jgi:hypothetical protein
MTFPELHRPKCCTDSTKAKGANAKKSTLISRLCAVAAM